jgi:hypothetical protein
MSRGAYEDTAQSQRTTNADQRPFEQSAGFLQVILYRRELSNLPGRRRSWRSGRPEADDADKIRAGELHH